MVDKNNHFGDKVKKVRQCVNDQIGQPISEIDNFWVDKGTHNSCLVYNGISYGVDQSLLAPWFSLLAMVTIY